MSSMRRPAPRKPVTSAAQTMQKVTEPGVQLNIRISPEMKRDLRRLAADEGRTVTAIVTELIGRHLEEQRAINLAR